MGIVKLLFIAVSLAMDAFAVSLTEQASEQSGSMTYFLVLSENLLTSI